jgi:hypothetical protein
MINVPINDEGISVKIPADRISLEFIDPDTQEKRLFIPYKALIGDLSYENITHNPFVYDRKNGYVSLGGEKDVLCRKLEPEQIALIEKVLKAREENETKETKDVPRNGL